MGNFNAGPDGGLFIDEGGQVIIQDSGFLWTTGGVTVDGTLTTSSRANRIGGGTGIVLGENGVLEITGNNADESSAAYNNISGTGSIKYSGSGAIALGPVSLSGLAVAALVGIILNAILPGKDYEFQQEHEGSQSVNFKV